mgnify:CR=1 FL=1
MSVDVEALERNVMRRIERAQQGASVGALSRSPVGEAIAWELASLLVDITENAGRDTIDDVIARGAQRDLELDLIDETSPAQDHVVVAEWTRGDGDA